MENKEHIRLTTPASSSYAVSMAEPGASENLVTSHSTARKGGGTVAAKYESGIVSEVNGDVHVNLTEIEAVKIEGVDEAKTARLKQKIKEYLERVHRKDKDGIPQDPADREKYFVARVQEWSQEALKEIIANDSLPDDVRKIRRDMIRIVYDKAKQDGIDLKKHFKNEADLFDQFEKYDLDQVQVKSAVLAANGHATLHQAQGKTETQLHMREIPENDAARILMYRNVFQNVAFQDENLQIIQESYNELIDREDPAIALAAGEEHDKVRSEDINNAIRLIENRLNSQPPVVGADATTAIQIIGNLRSISAGLSRFDTQEQREAYQQRQIINGVVDDETQREMKLDKIIWNRRARNKVFNDLYRQADSKPHEFWDRAFNMLTQGQREEEFMGYIQKIFQGNRGKLEAEYGHKILEEYYKLRQDSIHDEFTRRGQGTPPAGTPLTDPHWDTVFEILQEELQQDHFDYQKERQARETLHNANAILHRTDIQPEQLFGFIKQFGGELGDLAHRLHGVSQMMDIYESQLRMAMLEKGGYLSAEDVLGQTETSERRERGNKVQVHRTLKKSIVEERAKEVFLNLYNRGMIFMHTDQGTVIDMRAELNGAELQPWELERIMTISRGMMIASERLLSLAAESRYSRATQINQFFLQDILYAYSSRLHLEGKYLVPGPKTSAALAFEEGEEKWGPGDLWIKPHHVKSMKERHSHYKHDIVGFLESHDLVQMNKENPNRCGDLYTWLSWRAEDKLFRNESITRDFMKRGWDFLLRVNFEGHAASQAYQQLRQAAGIHGNPTPDEFFHQHAGVVYEKLTPEDHHPGPNIEDIAAMNMYIYRNGAVGNREQVQEMRDELNEYAKWMGTGLRFEKMRQPLDYLFSRDQEKRSRAEATVTPAMNLLRHIVDFQPDKLFLKSRKIQARVMPHLRAQNAQNLFYQQAIDPNTGLFSERLFQEGLRSTMSDLSFLQETVYRNRDRIIRNGGHFDNIDFIDRNGNSNFDLNLILDTTLGPGQERIPDASDPALFLEPPNPADPFYPQGAADPNYIRDRATYDNLILERQAMRNHIQQQLQNGTVRQFIRLMQADWDNNHGGPREEGRALQGDPTYFEEFIKYRENYHGFVLWSGDAPVEEFKMTAIGQTGAFTMRAGNNMDSGKAALAEHELLSHLSDLRKPEDVVGALTPIYKAVKNYDLDLANELMGEWADAILKVYGSDFMSVLPLIGGVKKYVGLASFIQTWYGKRMPVWQAAEKRHFLDLMLEGGKITKAKHKELLPVARARYWNELAVDKLNFPLQLLALATLLYIAKQTFDED